MVAEYRWLNKCTSFCLSVESLDAQYVHINKPSFVLCVVANGAQQSSSQASDSNSSTSSLSSGTPVSSLSGLSQVMFPPSLPFGSDMVDVCISTEDLRSETPHVFIFFSRTAKKKLALNYRDVN